MPGSARPPTERFAFLPRVLPFALLIVGIALDGALQAGQITLPWDLRWNYAVRSALAALALGYSWPALRELHGGSVRPLLALAVGMAVFALWIAPPLLAFSQAAGGIDPTRLWDPRQPAPAGSGFLPLDAAGALDWPLALSRLAGSSLVVPLAEELFWRSFVMRWIDDVDFRRVLPERCSPKALGLQALVFGLEHDLWLAGILAGLAYGWLYRRTGSLWPGVLAHAVTNASLGVFVLVGGHWSYW